MTNKDGIPEEPGGLRALPSVDAILRTETARRLVGDAGAKHLSGMARSVVDDLRRELSDGVGLTVRSRDEVLIEAEKRLGSAWNERNRTRLQKVINATGVIIHTNLGRAPLSDAARAAVANAAGYCTLEYDLTTGKRGRRGARAEKLLAELTGAEDALIVNNCAAAVYLVLTALAAADG